MGVGNNYYELQVDESELETEVMYYQGGTGRFAMRKPILRIAFKEFERCSNSRSKRASGSYVLYGSSEPRQQTGFLLETPHFPPN